MQQSFFREGGDYWPLMVCNAAPWRQFLGRFNRNGGTDRKENNLAGENLYFTSGPEKTVSFLEKV